MPIIEKSAHRNPEPDKIFFSAHERLYNNPSAPFLTGDEPRATDNVFDKKLPTSVEIESTSAGARPEWNWFI